MVHSPRLLIFAGAFFCSSSSYAQTPELDGARATFSEAVADEDAGREAVALEKFRRVAGVRDTAQVEYRIGTCLEALGQRRAAIVAYDRATHLGRGETQTQDVVAASNEKIASLAASMGKLALVIRGSDAPDVRVDGEVIAHDELGSALVVEPGEHIVEARASGMKAAHATVIVARGRKMALTLELVPDTLPPGLEHITVSTTLRDFGIGIAGTGAAFAIGAGAVLILRATTIASIHTDCPGNVCPIALHDQVESMRATASSLEPIAAVLGTIALVTAVTGFVLIALGPRRSVSASVMPSTSGAAFSIRGVF